MSKSDDFETALLGLIFNGTAIAGLAENAAAPLADLYLALHTADPGEAGTQATSECTYLGYARVAVARTGGALIVSGGSVALVANAEFPACTAGAGDTVTHFSIGTDASGATLLMYSGALDAPRSVAPDETPRLLAATSFSED